jgi:hypothetical protein
VIRIKHPKLLTMAPSTAKTNNKQSDLEPTTTVRTLTASCLTSNRGSKRIKYFQALELQRTFEEDSYVLKHNVLLGDLVVYSTSSGQTTPKCQGLVQIGQIVALYESKDQHSSAVDYMAMVRPFLFYKQVAHRRKNSPANDNNFPRLSEFDDKVICNNMRHQQVIFETREVETISCRQINLLRQVELITPSSANDLKTVFERILLDDESLFSSNSKVKKARAVDAWLLRYICSHSIDSTGRITFVDDWSHYSISAGLTKTLPSPLVRGFHCLENGALAQASRDISAKVLVGGPVFRDSLAC